MGTQGVLWKSDGITGCCGNAYRLCNVSWGKKFSGFRILGIGPCEAIGLQLVLVTNTRPQAEQGLNMVPPFMRHHGNPGKVADAEFKINEPAGGVINRPFNGTIKCWHCSSIE